MGKIAGDLSKLLGEIKIKPVIVSEQEITSSIKDINLKEAAIEIARIVFVNAPTGTDSSILGEALSVAAAAKADEYNIESRVVLEAVIAYLISAVESATSELTEDVD